MKESRSLLSSHEAAAFLGVHFRTILRWADKKKMPHIRYPNGRIKFRREDLTLWLESKTVVPAGVEHPTKRRERTKMEQSIKNANEILARHYPGKKRKLIAGSPAK